MPHCAAPCARKDACSADSLPLARPSTVRTARPCDGRRRHQAGADRLAVEQHRAGAAVAGVAADLGAGQPQLVAQHRRQPRAPDGTDTETGAPLTSKAMSAPERSCRRVHAGWLRTAARQRAAITRAQHDLARRLAPVVGAAAHVVDRRQARRNRRPRPPRRCAGRAVRPTQRCFERRQPLRHRRAGADRDRRARRRCRPRRRRSAPPPWRSR